MINNSNFKWHSALTLLLFTLLLGLPQAGRAGLTPLPPVTEADGRLGTCFSFYDGPQGTRAPQAYQAGSRWDRFDFRWDAIEKVQGVYTFAPHENVVAIDRAHGLDIIGILWATPAWAAAPGCAPAATRAQPSAIPGRPTPALLETGTTTACPPRDLNQWYTYVYNVVNHFKGDVRVWEIWNEPDLDWFWVGTPAQYAEVLATGYLAVKAADPEATVLFGGLAYWSKPTFAVQVLDVLAAKPGAAAHNGYFDVLSLHLYYSVYTPYSISRSLMQAVADRVGPHPLWITELGVALWDEHHDWPQHYTATGQEAAAHSIQAYAQARAAGVERVLYFRLHDETQGMTDPYPFGLTRDDASIRPAYLGYQVAAQYLRDENQVSGPLGAQTVRVTFWGTPHGRVDVLWNATGTPLTYTAAALLPTATLVSQDGTTTTLTATGGQFAIPLSPATNNHNPDRIYHIGGPPVLLIQHDTKPPQLTLHAPPVIYTSTVPLTWTVSDGGAGYWYTEIARASNSAGPWSRVAGLAETQGVTHTTAALPSGGAWYFRARARDQAGNWSAWSAPLSTTAILTRTVALTVTVYDDGNNNGVQDPAEVSLDATSIVWRDLTGAPIASGAGHTWSITRTVTIGTQRVHLHAPEHFAPPYTFHIPGGPEPLTLTLNIGMLVIRGRQYLPLVAQQASGP